MRMGTYYRSLVLEHMNIKPEGSRVMDVGCYDGYFLSDSKSKIKIGIDLKPVKSDNVEMIAADAMHLPFKIKFNKIFAFDVIEHVEDDKKFLIGLIDKLSIGSELILSTPSKNFKIFPGFLTWWLSKKWGHVRVGYSHLDIETMLIQSDVKINTSYWNAPFWRFLYFPLWILWRLAPSFARIFLCAVVKLDSIFPDGINGYVFVRIERLPD